MSDEKVHNSPWPAEMRAKFGDELLTVVTSIKSTTSIDDLAVLLRRFDLTESEFVLASKLMPQPSNPGAVRGFRASRAKFYAAAWSVGAAYRQMGRILGISHQTVHTAAGRLLGPQPKRFRSESLTDEQVETLYLEWQQHADYDIVPLIDRFLVVLDEWDYDRDD